MATNTSKGNVLVVMSGAHLLELKEGKVYATGYYLNELATPLKALVDNGYTPVFASPNGEAPVMDASSNDSKFFGGSDANRMEMLRFVDSFKELRRPRSLASIVPTDYVGVFVPGGHAPMVDLARSKDLGKVLRSFHDLKRPTALICHGPMALLSTLPETEKFSEALFAGKNEALEALKHDWPYAGYRMTAFSKDEEQQIEAPQMNGIAPYYNDEALASAGGNLQNAQSWHANVVVDRELITGQQPFSAPAFAEALIAKLAQS